MAGEEAGGRVGQLACGTCRHIDQRKPNDIFCRAHPPTIVIVRDKGKDAVRQFYPNVHPVLDWCGEHEDSS